MSGDVRVCQICLHTERKLKTIDRKLTIFHDELCEFSLKSGRAQYCSECELLLEQAYTFKRRCLKAQKILTNWKRTKTRKVPVYKIHTLLPSLDDIRFEESKILTQDDDCETNTTKVTTMPIEHQELKLELPLSTIEVTLTEPKLEVAVPISEASNCITNEDVNIQNIIDEPLIYQNKPIKYEVNDLTDDETDTYDAEELPTSDALNIKPECTELVNESIVKHRKRNAGVTNSLSNKDNLNEINDLSILNQREDEKKKQKKQPVAKSDLSDDETDDIAIAELQRIKQATPNDLSDDGVNKKVCNIVSELRTIANDANTIYGSYKEILLAHKKKALNNIFKKLEGQNKGILQKKGVGKRMDSFIDIIERLRIDNESVLRCIQPYSESFGDKTKETVLKIVKDVINSTTAANIDVDFVAHCLDDMVPPSYIKLLWNALNSKSSEREKKNRIMRMITKLQERYKNPKWETLSEIFQIEYLNTDEKIREDFETRKYSQSYVNANFKCDICYLGFKCEKPLQKHSMAHDRSNGTYTCHHCKVYYNNLKFLTKHNTHMHRVAYRCTLCPMVTHNIFVAEGHYNLHKGNKITCEICGDSLSWAASYYNHLLEQHGCNFVCTICAFAFPTEKKLEEHKLRHKKTVPEDGVVCDHCGLKFISQQVCNRHISQSHKPRAEGKPEKTSEKQIDGEPCVCEHCGAIFKTPRRCRIHVTWKHSTKLKATSKITDCRVCNEKFPSNHQLVRHFEYEHPNVELHIEEEPLKSHLCDQCGKRFKNRRDLKDHAITHTGELSHACAECPRRFATRRKLRHHLLYHRPKSYQCKYCGKMFRTPSNLRNHMPSHIQDRKYKCHLCGKGFLHSNALNEHIRGVHFNIRRVKKTQPTTANNTDVKSENLFSTTTGNVFPEPGNVFTDTGKVFPDAGNVFTETGNVFPEAGSVFVARNKRVVKAGSKRMIDAGVSVVKRNVKRRRQESGTESEDSD